jgi:alkanesulfonate monooxygenase SsuD/methylene tetrahydromethanopterin reductase-like flavin-dependent oxidoreductase (luciferase family)
MIEFGLTDHLEGPVSTPSLEIYQAIAQHTRVADELGFEYAWFAEHHAHAHLGHLPSPLLLALHLAGQTKRIHLGTAIICLNLHHPLAIAEQTAVADLLANGRMAIGFGSGSTPMEFGLFGLAETNEAQRHARFEAALRLITAAWRGQVTREDGLPFEVEPHVALPVAAPDLVGRSWLAVNSLGSAEIAGRLGFNMLFSHLRTPAEYLDYAQAYRVQGGRGRIAANRPVYVGANNRQAMDEAEPALRILWRRFQAEGKIARDAREPDDPLELCRHPINFIVGDAHNVAGQLIELYRAAPYDVANLEVRWAGLADSLIAASMRRLAEEVRPFLYRAPPAAEKSSD